MIIWFCQGARVWQMDRRTDS